MVVMGHNKDDCLENILQNISSRHKYDNLIGMDVCTRQNGVTFFRPLLAVSKNAIVNYARRHNIPFLPNSTPPSCHRGKIRNEVVPCLDAWNDRFIPGLFAVSDIVRTMNTLVHAHADALEICDGVLVVPAPYLHLGDYFWKVCIRKLFPDQVFKNKMFDSLMSAFSKPVTKRYHFELNKDVRMCVMPGAANTVSISFRRQ
jgi:tRNA(Ile)-lysidine synthase TilS/MesJ